MTSYAEFINHIKNGDKVKAKSKYDISYLNRPDEFGFQPIHWACLNSHLKVLKWLLKQKCELNTGNVNGWRPIHCVALRGNKQLLKILICNFCEIDCKTNNNETPLDIANGDGTCKFIDEICPKNLYREIGLKMGLNCLDNCDHRFCLSSFSSFDFKKGLMLSKSERSKIFLYKESRSNHEYILKKIKIDSTLHCDKDDLYIEKNINNYLHLLKHKNIMQYYGVICRADNKYLCMDYMPMGSLKKHIKAFGPLTIDKIIQHTRDLLEAVAFLHDKNIIHRNIQAKSILLENNGNSRLIGFDFSQILGYNENDEKSDYATTFCGTPNYLAPEVINDEPYGLPSDIWSVGATVIEMLTGKPPFHMLNVMATIFRIGNTKKMEYFPPKTFPKELKDLIELMVKGDPMERATARECLNSEFIISKVPVNIVDIGSKFEDIPSTINLARIRMECKDMIKFALDNKEIGVAMGLTCNKECDHKYCLSSMSSSRFGSKEMIGFGAFGKVYKIVESSTGRIFALKCLYIGSNKDNNNHLQSIEGELSNYRQSIKHERIVQYYGASQNTYKMYIYMEYVPGGSIKTLIEDNGHKPLKEMLIRKYCIQILEGLLFLHSHGIIHRDIKSENVLLTNDDNIKLVDFGLSHQLRSILKYIPTVRPFCGTANYMAPEVINEEEYDFSSDIWSFGAVVVEMMTGNRPYHLFNEMAIIFRIGTQRKLEYDSSLLSDKMKIFVNYLLQSNPKQRESAQSLLHCTYLS